MPKNTEELLKALKSSEGFQKYYTENQDELFTGDLPQLLQEIIAKTGVKRIDAILEADLSEVYGYQIFCGMRKPERGKLLRLAIALKADLDDVQKLLKYAGYAPLYVRLPADCVIIYGIVNRMTLDQIRKLLLEYGQEPI